MERPCPLFKDGLCILGEACPLSHETDHPPSGESGIRNLPSSVRNDARDPGHVTNSSMISRPNDKIISEPESHNDNRNPKSRISILPEADNNNNSSTLTSASNDDAEFFPTKKSEPDQNVDNSKEINYPTPQNSGVNGGLENQTLELCDEVKESHLPDGGNPSYAQTNSSGFPSTTFSNYVHPNPFYLVREIHGNLVYLQPRIPFVPMPQFLGHPQQIWLPNSSVPFPFNHLYHHQPQRVPGSHAVPLPTPHFNAEIPVMTTHVATGDPFNYHHVTSQTPSSGLIGNPMPNPHPINDSFGLLTHFQDFVQADEATSNLHYPMQQNVGDQIPFHLHTDPSGGRQDFPLSQSSDELNIADQPANTTTISQPNLDASSQPYLVHDNLFHGKSDIRDSYQQDSFQPSTAYHSHDVKLEETDQSGLKLSNAEFKSDRDFPRVYSVDELEKSFFNSDFPRIKSVSPKGDAFHDSDPFDTESGSAPLDEAKLDPASMREISSEARIDSAQKRLHSSGWQWHPQRPAPLHGVDAVKYFCHSCKKNIPNLSQGLCPFCSQSFVEDRSTIDVGNVATDDVRSEEWVLEGNKTYFCYVCNKDLENLGPDLKCPYCGDSFVEDKAKMERQEPIHQVQVNANPGSIYFCYGCEKDIHNIGDDLLCTSCGSSFVEEKANTFEHIKPVGPETGARSKIRPSGDSNKSSEGCAGFAFVPLPHLTQNFLDKEHKLIGLADRNPFSALIDNHESMTDFPPIPEAKKAGNKNFPFDATESINLVYPAVRGLSFAAERLTSEDHVGMSEPEVVSESDVEKRAEKIGKKKSEKKRENRRLAKKEHKKQEQMLKEKLELAKKKEDEIKLVGALEQKKRQAKKNAERERIAKLARKHLEKTLQGRDVAKQENESEKKTIVLEKSEAEVHDEAGMNKAEKSLEFSDFLLPECDLRKAIFEAEKLLNASNFKLAYEKFSLGLELLDSEVFLSQSKNRRLRHKLFILRAETLLKLERYEEAVKDATEAIRINEYQAKPYRIRAESNWKMGNTDQAPHDLLMAGQLDTKALNPFI